MMINVTSSDPVGVPVDAPDYNALDRDDRISLIARHLEEMGHALAGDVDPLIVAEIMLLADRVGRQLQHSGTKTRSD